MFVTSLVLLGVNWIVLGHSTAGTVVWVSLGSAVITRVYRNSLVNKYDAMLNSDAPMV